MENSSANNYELKYLKYKNKYLEMLQSGGNPDVDELTSLIFQKIPIDKDGQIDVILRVDERWARFFSKTNEQGFGIRHSAYPTQLLKDIINTHNSRGQTILYCIYRYNPSLLNFFDIPGMDLTLRNRNGDLPIVGLVWENKNHLFILEHLILYIKKSRLNLKNEGIYTMLQTRLDDGSINE